MSTRVYAAIDRAYALIDYNIYNDMHKQFKFMQKTILSDKSLTKDEKTEASNILNIGYNRSKVRNNEGAKRICKNCNQECLATLYCEHCVRNYLKANFLNWTSGNDDIDNLIRNCQMKTLEPDGVVEWIPYNNLQNIKYLTEGGCSKIYTGDWIGGYYVEWDSKEQQLKRFRIQNVILKGLENVGNADQRWFEEVKSHLTISNKYPGIVQCYGLTQDLSNGNYMLVMNKMDIDLRSYLQQNHNQLTWKERIQIAIDIINALDCIHGEHAIHRDLHSGNILRSPRTQYWFISDLGFCGPADKPLKSIYGNLPYIAPEVIAGKGYTFKSDVYSVAMLMWEISSGQPPFSNYEHDFDLAMNIMNGMRPKVVSGTPLEYQSFMEQCWDADPLKRPDIDILCRIFNSEINLLYNRSEPDSKKNIVNEFFKKFNLFQSSKSKTNNNLKINNANNLETNCISSKSFISKIYQFENLPEPRNATEEEQEEFHSKPYDFSIPDNIDDFDKSNNQNDDIGDFRGIQNIQSNYKKEIMQQEQIKRQNIDINDDDEIYNNPNLHSEEQDELEIPDDGF